VSSSNTLISFGSPLHAINWSLVMPPQISPFMIRDLVEFGKLGFASM